MKTKTFKLSLMAILLILGFSLMAQPPHRGKHMAENKEKIEAQKVAYITEKLALTPAESQKFWPIYNEYKKKEQELRMQHIGLMNKGKVEGISEADAAKIVDEMIIHHDKMNNLRKTYMVQIKPILPATKIIKLYEAERNFRKDLLKQLKGHPSTPPPSGTPTPPATPEDF